MTATAVETMPLLAWARGVESAVNVPRDEVRTSAQEARESARLIARLVAQLQSALITATRTIDDSDLPKSTGATSTGDLLARDFGGNRSEGDKAVRTAKNLATATLTDRALAGGEISLEQAEIVARAVAGLPAHLDEHTRLRIEKRLLSDAKLFSVSDLRRRVLRVADLYASKPEADADENTRLRAQERRARAATEFWMSPARDGLVAFGGKIPEAQADILKNCLGAVAAPRRRHLSDDPAADAAEELTAGQRLGRAFCTWIEHLPTDGFPTTGGTPAVVTVTIDYDTLIGKLEAAGTLSTGTRISAGEARRLACTAGILPTVLSGTSIPLDLGRSRRLFTTAQRLALANRDLGCTYPGCDRPPAWCEVNHIHPWSQGGNTNLDDGTLNCGYHHHVVHKDNIEVRNRNGRIEYRVNGMWKTNHRWRT